MREEDTVCVGSDGLRHCKVCGEAKEAFFPEGGFMGMKKHSRQCACDRKAYEEEQKYFKDKEHRELVSRNTSICFDESRMEEWTFENADMSDAVMHKAKSYVDNWEEMKRNHIGCLFWGPVGTGKSFIAGCIANELLKQEVTVKMTNFNTIIDDIFPLADKTEYINALASYQLLIIDDLGVERNSEYVLGIIFSVIDRRIRSGRPLIITTNLPLNEIKSETVLDKRRIYLDITGKDDSVHTGIFRSLDIFFKIVNKEAFRRIQIKFAEEIFVNFLIRFCHVDRSREQDPVERLQDLVILHIICKVSRCIGKEIDRDSPLFQFPDKCKRLWQWLCTARPFTEEKIHGIIKPFGNRTQNFISILLIIDRTAVQFSPVCIDQIAEIIDISRISNKRTNDLSAVKSSNHISKVKYDILIFHSKAPFREYSHLS